MAWITLEGMRFHAFHGVYEAEQVLGGEYEVHVSIKAPIDKAAATDNVEAAINYETIYQVCRLEMAQRRNLIERVAQGIVERMKGHFPTMQALRVRVRKVHPPLGGRVDAAWVEVEEEYVAECPRCKRKFIQFDDKSCWEQANIHPATRETLLRQFGKCLCPECMKLYAG